MRSLLRCLRAGVGSLALLGILGSPEAAWARSPGWTVGDSGCAPVTSDQPVATRTSPGREADTVFVMNDGVTYTPALHAGTGQPVDPSGTSTGELALTLEVLTDQRDTEPWPGLDELGFDISAMDDPEPDPIEINVEVSGARDVDTEAVRNGDVERAGMVTLLESETLSADAWDRMFGAYAVVAADLTLTTPQGDPWCEVPFRGTIDDPIDEFTIVPAGGAIDAATEAVREDTQKRPRYVLPVTMAAFAALLAAGTVAARTYLARRRKAATDSDADPPERDIRAR